MDIILGWIMVYILSRRSVDDISIDDFYDKHQIKIKELVDVFISVHFNKFKKQIIENQIINKSDLKVQITKLASEIIKDFPEQNIKWKFLHYFCKELYSTNEYTKLIKLLKRQNKENK